MAKMRVEGFNKLESAMKTLTSITVVQKSYDFNYWKILSHEKCN